MSPATRHTQRLSNDTSLASRLFFQEERYQEVSDLCAAQCGKKVAKLSRICVEVAELIYRGKSSVKAEIEIGQ